MRTGTREKYSTWVREGECCFGYQDQRGGVAEPITIEVGGAVKQVAFHNCTSAIVVRCLLFEGRTCSELKAWKKEVRVFTLKKESRKKGEHQRHIPCVDGKKRVLRFRKGILWNLNEEPFGTKFSR